MERRRGFPGFQASGHGGSIPRLRMTNCGVKRRSSSGPLAQRSRRSVDLRSGTGRGAESAAGDVGLEKDQPRWPFVLLADSGSLVLHLLLVVLVFLGAFGASGGLGSGSKGSRTRSSFEAAGLLLLVGWAGVLAGIIGVAITTARPGLAKGRSSGHRLGWGDPMGLDLVPQRRPALLTRPS